MVTCKEPLRASMISHMLIVFITNGLSEVASEKDSILKSTDNLDLVCTVIEKTAMEKVIAEVDEILMNAYTSRKKHREQQRSNPYFDMDIFSLSRYPATLPEPLRPKPNGLHVNQLRIYEDFMHVPRLAPQGGQTVEPLPFEQQRVVRSNVGGALLLYWSSSNQVHIKY
ncbi:hypothetical protein G6F68_016510 [Rhizopus microsporus]|nr:hypothetical protein G6F68_016510 [Rhizopus microsporus]